ncbi:MAG: HU family DNA-binding protein [Prevotella sp.]|nr:HU family DNA-binding protein [Prevotella sp.]
MNNKEFVAELSRRMGYKNEKTQRLLQNVLNSMGDRFLEGDALQVPNFGTFEVKKKLERVIVNPTTGQRMLVPPKMVLGFKPYSSWKDKLKNGGDE